MSNPFILATDIDCDVYALYDKDRKLIVSWQAGDDISRVLKTFMRHNGDTLSTKYFRIDSEIPQTI